MTSNVELAVRVCGLFNDDDYCALDVLRQIVGGSTSSRLFVELREKRGLTYNSRVYLEFYEPAGIFVICAKSDSDKLVKDGNSPGVLPTILSLVDDLIKRGVSNAEIKWAKTRIKEMGIMNKDQVVDQCEYNGERVMLNNDTGIVPHDQIYERRYASITKSTVDAVIRKYFSPRVYFLSIMGGRVPRRSVIEKLM
jgi:predicted Zn-dependent peptidase